MDLNKAMIIGRLTRDPELRTIPNGTSVVNFSIATSYTYTDQSGERQEKTEYHDIVMWRKLAEIAGQYLTKGSQVYIEGRLQTRSWDDPNGFKRYRTEIVGDNMIMLARAKSSTGAATYQQPAPPPGQQPPASPSTSSDSPFPSDSPAPVAAEAESAAPTSPTPAPEEDLPTIDVNEEATPPKEGTAEDEEVSVEEIPF